jgi:intracellular sulfur oxidation DsrE/DsrF family protein
MSCEFCNFDDEKNCSKKDPQYSKKKIAVIRSNAIAILNTVVNGNYTFDRKAFFKAIDQKEYDNRLVFGASRLVSGQPLINMQNLLNAYASKENSMLKHPIVIKVGLVAFGNILFVLLNDSIWDTYHIRAFLISQGETLPATPLTGNPFLTAPFIASITALMSEGAVFVMCNNTLAGLSLALAPTLSLTPEAVYLGLKNNILPGVQLAPAGVAALNEMEKEGWKYIQASVPTM